MVTQLYQGYSLIEKHMLQEIRATIQEDPLARYGYALKALERYKDKVPNPMVPNAMMP